MGIFGNSDNIQKVVPEQYEADKGAPKRETWSTKIDFLLACIGFSVGLGNVWRFPYLCYKNGGGAFLVPYFITVIFVGIPAFAIEVFVGQFMGTGGFGAWKIVPLMQGVGFAMVVVVVLLDIYYNVILAWAWYYLFASFTSELPWQDCDHAWASEKCFDDSTNKSMFHPDTKWRDSVVEYWEDRVLQITDGVENLGELQWELTLCLLFAWVVIYLCICQGIKSSGKVMYVTATSPYILMLILLVRGCTLDGAGDGIRFYLEPDIEKLKDENVWVDAGTQVFFSYSISLGTLTALGSYNHFNHNCYRDSVLFAIANSGTSFLAGFVIFSVLGFMAKELDVPIEDVAAAGPGLAFIAYPKAVAKMPFAPPLWSILFFIMVILLGMDSQFVGVEGFVTAVVDFWPNQLRVGYRKEIFIGITCFCMFLVGIPMTMQGGMYVFQMFDYYSGSRIIILICFFECVTIAWIYGINRFYDNIKMMLGWRINPYMWVSWVILTPVYCLIIFALIIYTYSELSYADYFYPDWAIAVGWIMALSSIAMLPLVAIVRYCMASGSPAERWRTLITPQLKPHQLRPQDPIEELDPKYRDSYAMNGGKGAEYDGAGYDGEIPEKTGYANPGFPVEKTDF